MNGAGSPLLRATDISCIRGGNLLFTRLNLTLHGGRSLLAHGPNGCGKSSLLRLLAGLLPCRTGKIEWCADIALTDDRPGLDDTGTLRDALAFWARLDGAPRHRMMEAMESMALLPLADIPVAMLSTGQLRRAALARTIASNAPVWLLDEPGNGLDGDALLALGQAMDRHKAQGGGIVATSHFALPHDFDGKIELGANALS